MKKGLFNNKYLNLKNLTWHFVLILILASIIGFLYSKGYLYNPTTASQETINSTYNVTSNDDLMNQDGTSISRGSNEMWIGTKKNISRSYLGIRFTGKKLPLGAKITAAEITFTSPADQSTPISTTTYIENTRLAAAFSTQNTPSQRSLLRSKKIRKDTVSWQKNTVYSYDVTDLIKDAYKTNGINGSIAIIIKGSHNETATKTIYGSPSSLKSPRLRIQYHVTNDTILK